MMCNHLTNTVKNKQNVLIKVCLAYVGLQLGLLVLEKIPNHYCAIDNWIGCMKFGKIKMFVRKLRIPLDRKAAKS